MLHLLISAFLMSVFVCCNLCHYVYLWGAVKTQWGRTCIDMYDQARVTVTGMSATYPVTCTYTLVGRRIIPTYKHIPRVVTRQCYVKYISVDSITTIFIIIYRRASQTHPPPPSSRLAWPSRTSSHWSVRSGLVPPPCKWWQAWLRPLLSLLFMYYCGLSHADVCCL